MAGMTAAVQGPLVGCAGYRDCAHVDAPPAIRTTVPRSGAASAGMSVAAARVGSEGDDDQRKPFREMWQFKAVTLTALPAVTAGIVATGAPIAKYYRHASADGPGAAAGVATYDRADPYHSDPGGEFIRIEPPDTGGTRSVSFVILAPSD
jgi:hypothetical protein